MTTRRDKEWGTVWRFFLVTYGVAWLAWTPAVVLRGRGPSLAFLVLGAFAPSAVAVLLTALTRDRAAPRDLWTRVIDVRRIGWRWLAIVLLLYPAANALTFALAQLLGQRPPPLTNVTRALGDPLMIAQIVVANLIISGFSEELGWRGYALDRLQARWRPLPASLILGLAHGLWHLPLFFIPGITQGEMGLLSWGALSFLIGSVAGAVPFTWVYNNTRRSVLSAILLHFVANVCIDLLAGLQGALPSGYFFLYAGAIVLVDVGIVATWRPSAELAETTGRGVRLPSAQ